MLEVTGTVQKTKRLRNSKTGQPIYDIALEDGRTFRTGSNSASGYYASNVKPGDEVTLVLIRNRISNIVIKT